MTSAKLTKHYGALDPAERLALLLAAGARNDEVEHARLGTENTHFYRTEYQYDATGAVKRSETPLGTITRIVRDGIGRAVSEWVGTDDTPTSGNWSPTNTAGTNLVKVRELEYDGGGVGDGNVTKVTEYPGNSATARVTQTWFDWRNRAVAVKSGVEGSESTSVNRPLAYYDFDNLNNVVKVRAYDADGVTPSVTGGVPQPLSSSLLRAQTTTSYDELGRAYLSEVYSVDPSSGSVGGNTLKSQSWFDARGLTVKTSAPGGAVQKSAFDGAGRLTASYVTDGGGDSAYSDADDVTGDIVLEQAEYAYDASGNVLTVTSRARFHDASGTGALGSPSSGIGARVSYSGFYYDLADRQTATVDVGTNGGSSWTRPGTVPTRSSTVLVNSVTFDAAGRVYEATDAAGRVLRTTYDALGRTTKTVENYVDGTVSDGDDKTTEFTYNAAGMTSLSAKLTGGGVQTTEWVFGVTQGSGSAVDSNDIVGLTKWPDPSSGAASSGQQETTTVNALGQTLTMSDRNGSTHTLTYDVLGRVVSDAVTTLGSGVDGGVRRIETAYDGQGNAYLITSYDAASSGNVVNQVQRAFNGLGQLVTEWQAHGGAVNTSTSPKVQYAWTEMASGANHSRLTSVTYASGYVLTYNYASGLNSDISRLTSLSDANGTLESYDHLGFGTVVRRGHSQPNVDLSFIKRSGESNTDAGDQYTGLDRFGRVVDQRWMDATSGTSKDRIQYGYDAMGNRLYRDNLVNAAFGELYTYDGLNQLSSFDRGTLNGTKTGLTGAASATQTLDFDAVGNWESVTTNGTTQTRGHNKQNEITSVSGATTPTFDANGNMTGDETGRQFVYDAWNRMVEVKNSGGTSLKTFEFDGLNRRISETASGTTRDFYYSAQWQVLEERVSGNTERRYVWSPVYVDALVLRDRDTNADGSLDERLYVVQDANFNVVALLDTSGNVVERYTYSPFGVQTVYDASWTVRGGGSSYSFTHGFQGMAFDATSGTNKSRGRTDYSPTLGRWTSIDPIYYTAGDVVLYRAMSNNTVNRVDPSGLVGHAIILVYLGKVVLGGTGSTVIGGGAAGAGIGVLSGLLGNGAPTPAPFRSAAQLDRMDGKQMAEYMESILRQKPPANPQPTKYEPWNDPKVQARQDGMAAALGKIRDQRLSALQLEINSQAQRLNTISIQERLRTQKTAAQRGIDPTHPRFKEDLETCRKFALSMATAWFNKMKGVPNEFWEYYLRALNECMMDHGHKGWSTDDPFDPSKEFPVLPLAP